MKLFRWAAAGASVYVIYKYSIGKKAKGESVFQAPDGDEEAAAAAAKPAKRKAKPARAKAKA